MKQEHRDILNDYWAIFKKHIGIKQGDPGWRDMLEELTDMHEKYKETDYAKFTDNLFFAFLNEITRLSR